MKHDLRFTRRGGYPSQPDGYLLGSPRNRERGTDGCEAAPSAIRDLNPAPNSHC